jgi:hypothetical protein
MLLRPTQSHWLDGTRHMTVACDGGVLVRRLGCYGGTAAAFHPSAGAHRSKPVEQRGLGLGLGLG